MSSYPALIRNALQITNITQNQVNIPIFGYEVFNFNELPQFFSGSPRFRSARSGSKYRCGSY